MFKLRGVLRGYFVVLLPGVVLLGGPADRAAEPAVPADKGDARMLRLGLDHSGRNFMNARVTAAAFSPDGKTLVAAHYPWGNRLWDLTSGKELCEVNGAGDGVDDHRSLVIAPDGKHLASVHAGHDLRYPYHFVHLWEIGEDHKPRNPRTLLARERNEDRTALAVYQAAFSPDGKTLLAGSADGTLYLWETATGKERLRFKAGVAGAFTPDGRSIIAVRTDGTVCRWDAATGQPIAATRAKGPTGYICALGVAFSPDGKRVAISDTFALCLKDVATGNVVSRWQPRCLIDHLVFSPDSQVLAVTDSEKGVCFLDANTGKEQGWLAPEGKAANLLAFSADGRTVAWGDKDEVVVQAAAAVLAHKDRPQEQAKTEPAGVPLVAEWEVNQDTYDLDLNGQTAEDFSAAGKYPSEPRVNLVFKVRNISDKKVTLRRCGPDEDRLALYLVGDGAINLPSPPIQTGVPDSLPPVTLAPGQSHAVPVKRLASDDFGYSFWLLPGEYELHAQYFVSLSPAPKGVKADGDGSLFVTVRAAPLKLTVRAAKK